MSRSLIRALLVVPWALACAALAWLVIQRFPPSGSVTFDIPFDGSSAWMDPFLPAERTTRPGAQEEGWRGQRILQDPVYASARLPGVYEDVDVELEFRPIRQPLVEFGILRDPDKLSFEFQPIWFAPLESEGWRETMEGERHGFVRASATASLLASGGEMRLAVWHASATPLEAVDPPGASARVSVSLRGGHDIWALPAGDSISFTFDLQDANRSAGPDSVLFRVYRGTEELRHEVVGVGGSRDERMGPVVTKTIRIDKARAGVYRIQIVADDDIFIRSVQTTSRHWVVGPRLVFGDTVGYATSSRPGVAWSNSRHLVLQTFHREGLQDVSFGDKTVRVTRTHDTFPVDRTDADSRPVRVYAPAGDVRIVGDGWFSFSPEAFFSPQPRRITDMTDPDAERIEAILTPYVRPEAIGEGWFRASVHFALDPSDDRVRFALSAPNLLSRAAAVDIRRVRMTYRRPPLNWNEWWRLVRREAGNAWRRLR